MYRLLANNTSDLICLQEPDGTFKYISPSIENLLGYKQSDFIGKKAKNKPSIFVSDADFVLATGQ